MSSFSGFAPFGLLDFSDAPTDAETAYDALSGNYGSKIFDFSEGTLAEAELYARSLQVGIVRGTVKRARLQQWPKKAVDKLPSLEKDWAVVPGPDDTIIQRQDAVAARELLVYGSREEALVTDLTAAIGDDFIRIRKTADSERLTYPSAGDIVDTGAFPLPSAPPKFFIALDPVTRTSFVVSIRIQRLNDSNAPVLGERYCIDSSIPGITESTKMLSIVDDGGGIYTITGLFQFAHAAGSMWLSACPVFQSTQRELQVIVSQTAARTPNMRRLINQVMARHVKTTTRWRLLETTSTTTVGPFVVGDAVAGATAVGITAFTF